MSCQNGLRMLHALCGRQVVRQEAKQMRKKKGKFPHFVNFATHYEGTDAVINMRKGSNSLAGLRIWTLDIQFVILIQITRIANSSVTYLAVRK